MKENHFFTSSGTSMRRASQSSNIISALQRMQGRSMFHADLSFVGGLGPYIGFFPFGSTIFTCGGKGLVSISISFFSWSAKINRPSSIFFLYLLFKGEAFAYSVAPGMVPLAILSPPQLLIWRD